MKKYLFITVVLLATLGICIWYAQEKYSPPKPSQDDRPITVFVEHYQPKMKTYLLYPLTVENTEITCGFNRQLSVNPKQHAAIVRFFNGIMKSEDNSCATNYKHCIAHNYSITLNCKEPSTASIQIDVYDRFIETSDNEVIVPAAGLLDLLKNLSSE